MKAMILAAGYGTRLRPLTYFLPKPVIPVCGKPMIAYAVENLIRAGVREIVVNLHYLPDAIESFLVDAFPDVTFHFSLEHEILGTGGGVKRVRHVFEHDEAFFLVNGDTIQNPRYDELLRALHDHEAIAALTLRHAPRDDKFTAVWHDRGLVTGFGKGTGEPLMFAGSHAISSRIFELFPDEDEFSIIGVYEKARIAAVVDDGTWFDIGTPQRYLAASRALCGDVAVGANSVVEGEVSGSAIWENCRIAPGVRLENCIVADGVELDAGTFANSIICLDDPLIPRDAPYRREEGLVIAAF
jgi:NDP-sugar pyrophosphorylase family protein